LKEGFLSSQVFAEDHMQMGCARNPFFFFILLKPGPLQMTKLVIIEYEEQVIGSVDSIISNLKSSRAVFLFERQGETVLIHASDKSNAKAAAAVVQQIPSESTLSSLQGSILQPAENQIPVPMKLILMIRPSCSKTSSPFMQYLPAKSLVELHLLRMSLDVLCLAPSHLSAADAATLLVVPALCDQLNVMCMMANKNATHNPKVKGLLSCFLSFERVLILHL
jgi:hypothetical protein